MATVFLIPEEGTYSAPCLPPDWLWAYAPEPIDNVYYVHQPSGNTQWEYPGDDSAQDYFLFWLSEQLKVDDDGNVAGVSSAGTRGLDGPTGERAFHGFGKPQKLPSSGKTSLKSKLANFFVGDFHYRPPPGRPPVVHSHVKPGHPWRPWKEEEGMYVGAPVAKPPTVTPFYTPTNSTTSHSGHSGANLSPRPSTSSQYSQHSQFSQNTAQAYSPHAQGGSYVGANLSSRPSNASQFSTYSSYQSHESHQSAVPSLSNSTATSSYTTPLSPQMAHSPSSNPPPYNQQWQSTPSLNNHVPYATQTQLPPPQSPPTSYYRPPTSPNPNGYKPPSSQGHGHYDVYVPPTINAGAFKPRPREMEDGPEGGAGGGGYDNGYCSDQNGPYSNPPNNNSYDQYGQYNNSPSNNWQSPAPGGHAASYYSSTTLNNGAWGGAPAY